MQTTKQQQQQPTPPKVVSHQILIASLDQQILLHDWIWHVLEGKAIFSLLSPQWHFSAPWLAQRCCLQSCAVERINTMTQLLSNYPRRKKKKRPKAVHRVAASWDTIGQWRMCTQGKRWRDEGEKDSRREEKVNRESGYRGYKEKMHLHSLPHCLPSVFCYQVSS